MDIEYNYQRRTRRKPYHYRGCSQIDVIQEIKQYISMEVDTEEKHGHIVQHVKDGKPLTPEGAKMLGVEWRK